MLSNPSLRKLVQISEEASPSVHVPLILGNDFFILTQQDVRKIEDTRLFSISKLMPNGDLKTINYQDGSDWLQNLLCNQNLSKSNCYQQWQQALSQLQKQYSPAYGITCPQPMEISTSSCNNPTVASVEEQIQWDKCKNTSAPFPMKYSHGTSTTEINYIHEIQDQQNVSTCTCCKMCQQCGSCRKSFNKSTNTHELLIHSNKKSNEVLDAREQLKKKKIKYFST